MLRLLLKYYLNFLELCDGYPCVTVGTTHGGDRSQDQLPLKQAFLEQALDMGFTHNQVQVAVHDYHRITGRTDTVGHSFFWMYTSGLASGTALGYTFVGVMVV